MSTYRAKDELTRYLINAALTELAAKTKQPARRLLGRMVDGLNRHQMKVLANKGGEDELWRVIYYLNSRGYIKKAYGRKDEAVYDLTTSGWRRLQDLRYVPLAERIKSWDGKWRVLLFDIPEDKRDVRDAIRRLIKHLGFVQLQRSVWIQPLECSAELEELKHAYNVEDDLTLLVVESFDTQKSYHKFFARKLPQLR